MGGCRCSYKNCERATNNSDKNFHFFHYPSKDYERSLKWITNARKPAFLDLPRDQLRNKVVCQNHFEMHCFTNANKQRLVHNAVPTLDTGCPDTPEAVNLKVLQADANGTVFTVDTESLNVLEINKVRSFLITNGDVVPANQSQEEESDIDETGNLKHQFYNDYKMEDANEVEQENSVKLELGPESNSKATQLEQTTLVSYNNTVTIPAQNPPPPTSNTTTMSTPRQTATTPKELETPDICSISKTVENHTKEITKLKKLLHSRIRKTKHKKLQILSKLRSLIPSSLYAAVSLHIFRKEENFSVAEKHFLTTLYQSPPAVINVLNDRFKWKLPQSDVVKHMLLNKKKLK